jgi:hypothetical protein
MIKYTVITDEVPKIYKLYYLFVLQLEVPQFLKEKKNI